MNRDVLGDFLDQYLSIKRFRDYTVNGLQVEGKKEIQKIVTAVTASQAAINFAVAQQADALLVHHGYFWKGEPSQITGLKKNRIQTLLAHDINLFAYHLPLDQHAELGNNILLGQAMVLEDIQQAQRQDMLWMGNLQTALSFDELYRYIEAKVAKPIVTAGDQSRRYQKIAWCTGAAQDYLADAAAAGADVFISGEYAERTYYEANELGILYLACGHHKTEILGIKNLGIMLEKTHNLSHIFYDDKNPF